MTDRWPTRLVPRAISFVPAMPVRRGPRSFAGVSQLIGSDAGYWRATLTEIDLRGDKILAMRAMIARMQGGLVPVLMGPWDCRRSPVAGSGLRMRGIPYADQAKFSDGAGFAQDAVLGTTMQSIALRATRLLMKFNAGIDLQAGQYFGLGGDRLHLVSNVEPSGGNILVNFWPPTRAALAGYQPVEIADPVCRMRLAADPESLELDMLRFGKLTLEFEEAL